MGDSVANSFQDIRYGHWPDRAKNYAAEKKLFILCFLFKIFIDDLKFFRFYK